MEVENLAKGVVGLILILGSIWIIALWWSAFLTIVKGFLPVFLILAGLIFILLAFEK
ncbi:MAG TPA: hypothetical protein VJB89_00530 [Candidatus Nanoarchaeia archaeon]|nr:hypothetical protein [Candidatus Nanoarchaeia archaeon]